MACFELKSLLLATVSLASLFGRVQPGKRGGSRTIRGKVTPIMGKTLISLLGCSVLPFCALASETDSRVREIVDPVRVVASRCTNDVLVLLREKYGQVCEGKFGEGTGPLLEPGDWLILDYGRELHGSLQIGTGTKSGQKPRARVRFGESVVEALAPLGERGACNDHAIRDDVISLPFMGRREIGETGFRFVRLENTGDCPIQLEYVRAVSLMRPMKRIGAFRSSDERLNRVFGTAVRTVHLCCQDYVWDGIKRDRLVWMGDMHPETMAILNVFGATEVVPRTLNYIAETTDPEDWVNGFPTYTLWWLRNLAAWYRFTGDRKFLGRFDDYLEKTFSHVTSVIADGVWTKTGEYGAFLDWPTHHNPEAELAGAQALAVLAMDDLRFLLAESGRAAAAGEAGRLLERMRKTHPDPHGAKSAAAMLALSGLRDSSEMFASTLGQDGPTGVSTFYGYYMIEAMSLAGQGQRALDTVRDYWGGMLDMGATSFWEDFNLAWTNNAFRIDELPVAGKRDIHGDYGEFCYKGFRHSLCHGWSSGPAAWCINHVLGIRPMDVGCKTIEVKPFLGDLEWAEGAMALPTGESVRVRADRQADGELSVRIDAPDCVRIVRDLER